MYSEGHQHRHCTCVYYQDWHRSKQPRPAVEGGILPAVARQVYPSRQEDPAGGPGAAYGSPRNTLTASSGVVVAVNDEVTQAAQLPPPQSGLPFDEEAKLVYGVVLSLRNMVKKLSGK